ncbi:MAG: ABC transporter permease subunit, partial [Oscillospiraceae bacterium]|nr:ABC transporter permease subunit [Oscillospiraceae bacterium]
MPETSKKIALASRNSRRASLIFAAVLAALFAASTWFTKFNPLQVISAQEEFWSFILTDFVPPYMGRWRALIDAVLQTLYMALSSAGISAALSLILAFLGTPGVCRFRAVNAAVRGFASIIRNIPAMVWVFILVGAYGIGTEVGVLSLIIGTTGYLTRSYIETLDEVAERNLEPLKAAGAGILPTISQAILPAAAPGLIAWFLYCIELNIRASAIIGMVGAGGIGLLMMGYIKQYNYAAASTAILAVAVIVIAVNLLTDWLRKLILRRHGLPTKIFLAVSALVTVASLALLRLDFAKIAERTPRLGHVFAEMAKLSTEKFSLTAIAMAETVAVSILSLIYGLILGLILGALSARNITP